MSPRAWAALCLQPAIAAAVTFGLFHNGWETFVASLSLQRAWVVYAGTKGWV